MVNKNSAVWTISTEDLITHLEQLDAPDQLYWDARELKKSGQKFQKMGWEHFPKPQKIDGEWRFA